MLRFCVPETILFAPLCGMYFMICYACLVDGSTIVLVGNGASLLGLCYPSNLLLEYSASTLASTRVLA